MALFSSADTVLLLPAQLAELPFPPGRMPPGEAPCTSEALFTEVSRV
jgi:hypothetical protein